MIISTFDGEPPVADVFVFLSIRVAAGFKVVEVLPLVSVVVKF